MPASLEPPSLRRRDKDPDAPREPTEKRSRRVPPAAPLAVVLLVLTALVGVVLFAYSTFHGTGGEHEDARVAPTTSAAPPAVQLPPAEYDAVETAARSALSAWARPGLAYRAWWRVLEPLLSPSARTDYAGTDPAQLPDLNLEPKAQVVPGPSEDTATVYVATSAGRFGIDLTREGAKSPWQAKRFLFPGEGSSLS